MLSKNFNINNLCLSETSSCGIACSATTYLKIIYTGFSAVENSLYGINVSYFINLLTTTKMESSFILVISSLDGGNFIIKFNKTELYALSRTYNSYNFLYRRYLSSLVL